MLASNNENILEAANTIYQLSQDEAVYWQSLAREDYYRREAHHAAVASRLTEKEDQLVETEEKLTKIEERLNEATEQLTMEKEKRSAAEMQILALQAEIARLKGES